MLNFNFSESAGNCSIGERRLRAECLSGQGDNPIEYYDPDEQADPVPLDVAAINKRLNKLATADY
jgi:hypothetical protein